MEMTLNFKLPFLLLVFGVVVAGVVPFAISQQGGVEPSMEIDMVSGQTQNPFRIQDFNDQDIFTVDTTGNITPDQIQTFRFTPTQTWVNSIIPVITTDSPDTVITQTSESGAGVYQWEYTIQEGDLPTADSEGMFTLEDITMGLSYNAENIGGGAISHNTKQFLNDDEINAEVLASHSAGNFAMLRVSCYTCFDYDGSTISPIPQFLQVGDTIGIKMWTDSTGDLVLRDVVLYAVPVIVIDVESWGISQRWSTTEGVQMCTEHGIGGLASECGSFATFQGVDGSSQNWMFDIGYYVRGQPIYDFGGILDISQDAVGDLMTYTFGVYPQEDWIRYSDER
jgi:hypothetical protein